MMLSWCSKFNTSFRKTKGSASIIWYWLQLVNFRSDRYNDPCKTYLTTDSRFKVYIRQNTAIALSLSPSDQSCQYNYGSFINSLSHRKIPLWMSWPNRGNSSGPMLVETMTTNSAQSKIPANQSKVHFVKNVTNVTTTPVQDTNV